MNHIYFQYMVWRSEYLQPAAYLFNNFTQVERQEAVFGVDLVIQQVGPYPVIQQVGLLYLALIRSASSGRSVAQTRIYLYEGRGCE